MHRLTFSKSLAEHIVSNMGSGYELHRRGFVTGHTLQPGERSKSGAYAVIDTHKGTVLRITLFAAAADLFRDSSRIIAEAWLA